MLHEEAGAGPITRIRKTATPTQVATISASPMRLVGRSRRVASARNSYMGWSGTSRTASSMPSGTIITSSRYPSTGRKVNLAVTRAEFWDRFGVWCPRDEADQRAPIPWLALKAYKSVLNERTFRSITVLLSTAEPQLLAFRQSKHRRAPSRRAAD